METFGEKGLGCLPLPPFSYAKPFLGPAKTGNVGAEHAIFEQGVSAGNEGKLKLVKQKKANPVALLFSSLMLWYLQFPSFADRLETAVKKVITNVQCQTKDPGGNSITQEVVNAVVASLN